MMICAHYPGVMNLTDDNHSLHKKATKSINCIDFKCWRTKNERHILFGGPRI